MIAPDCPDAEPAGVRWIPPLTLPGPRQMAIDEWLLEAAGRPGGGAALRFYRWRRPTLSLGRHQRAIEDRWRALAAAGRLELVRRPSGGGAVLHAGELTYALVWPSPPRGRRAAYRLACRWLRSAFADLGLPLVFGSDRADAGAAHCFSSSTPADLVHPDGTKRIGSAQLWRGGRMLQHGSILIAPPPDLWREVFAVAPPPLPPLPVDGDGLIGRLRQSAERLLPLAGPLRCRPLDAGEERLVAGREGRYRAVEPVAGVTSPEATIERAT
ncbi:MAG: lipoate--protein ligase family protein [Synechococcaceae cyanobacterium]|nr:lipoate--protein ligase family protein [Synechococcaceae cyanobacterium]